MANDGRREGDAIYVHAGTNARECGGYKRVTLVGADVVTVWGGDRGGRIALWKFIIPTVGRRSFECRASAQTSAFSEKRLVR